MSHILESYLDRVMVYAHRDEPDASDIRNELRDHLLKKIDDLKAEGLSAEDARYQAINAHGHPRTVGYGLRPRFPLIDVRSEGTARGVIAVGPRAVGIVAWGGVAFGVVAFGGVAVGVVTFGGLAAAILFAFGGVSVGAIACGGCAVGLLAMGGFAAGMVAVSNGAIGLVADGSRAISFYALEDAPKLLKGLLEIVRRSAAHVVWINLIMLSVLLVPGIMIQILSVRERRRIESADPWLVEYR